MSKETVRPPDGPAGPGQGPQLETKPLLSTAHGESKTTRKSALHCMALVQTMLTGCLLSRLWNCNHFCDYYFGWLILTQNFNTVPCPGARTAMVHSSTMTEQPRPSSGSVSHKMHKKLRSSLSVNSDSSHRSKSSSSSSQKPPLPEDCCVHCILACLFCEFLTLCNMVVAQASCGTCTSEACCCCCHGDDLGDDCNCPCDMDCGIMDACCESSDCLEICMECCGICFPT
uniref:Uncharacterized protein n=1 Tax=Periophthalmus magnuspinnatus TaxID=409849 RepID=A0A3B4B1X6_9GOBI